MHVELFDRICEAIRYQPKRINMGLWMDCNTPKSMAPCGTAACIAGFAFILGNEKRPEILENAVWRQVVEEIKEVADDEDIRQKATELLDLDEEQAYRLFFLKNWPSGYRALYDRAQSAQEQAKVVIDRIQHFVQTKGED